MIKGNSLVKVRSPFNVLIVLTRSSIPILQPLPSASICHASPHYTKHASFNSAHYARSSFGSPRTHACGCGCGDARAQLLRGAVGQRHTYEVVYTSIERSFIIETNIIIIIINTTSGDVVGAGKAVGEGEQFVAGRAECDAIAVPLLRTRSPFSASVRTCKLGGQARAAHLT